MVQQQFDVGAATRTDVLTQQSEVATTQATLPPLQKQLEQQRHVLLALIGRFPNEAQRDHMTLASLRLPTDLPLSLPSQLVEQRPDVRAARGAAASGERPDRRRHRRQAAAVQSHRGVRHRRLDTAALFSPSTTIWSIAASGTQPIFHGFTLLHQERAAKAAYDVAEAQYRNTVLGAFQNVADALRALQLDAATLQAQARGACALRRRRSIWRAGSIGWAPSPT